ncbi:MAG TPA: hypothetical protein VKV80_08260 [Streptosporangiaceae bacterium]|nr:hypothetical protein [Streptosporangiaceae bacterium]
MIRELTARARAEGLKLTGEGGLLGKLTKMVAEGALDGEMDDHPGYSKHAPEVNIQVPAASVLALVKDPRKFLLAGSACRVAYGGRL